MCVYVEVIEFASLKTAIMKLITFCLSKCFSRLHWTRGQKGNRGLKGVAGVIGMTAKLGQKIFLATKETRA